MSFDWKEYLKLAKYLHINYEDMEVDNSSILRTSISRSYYAAHKTAVNYIKYDLGDIAIPDTGKAHEYAIAFFEENSDMKLIAIGVLLGRLRSNRSKADYDEEINNLNDLTIATLRHSDDFFLKLDKLRACK